MKKVYIFLLVLVVSGVLNAQSRLTQIQNHLPYQNSNNPGISIYANGLVQLRITLTSTNHIMSISQISPNMQKQWEKTFLIDGSNPMSSILEWSNPACDGRFIYQAISTTSQSVLICLDTAGSLLWAKTIHMGSEVTQFNKIAAKDGYVYLGLRNPDIESKFGAAKIDSAGNIVWQKGFLSAHISTFMTDIKVNNEGELFICGFENHDMFLIKLDESGNMLYNNSFVANDTHISGWMYMGEPTPDGGIIGYGTFSHDLEGTHVLWTKIDSTGNTNAFRMFSDVVHYFELESITSITENSYFMAVRVNNTAYSSYENILIEVDASGQLSSLKHFPQDLSGVLAMGHWDNNLVTILVDSTPHIFQSPAILNSCHAFSDFVLNITNLDPALFPVQHPITASTEDISFTPANVVLLDITTFDLLEECYSPMGTENENEFEFKMYPNPTSDYFTIQTDGNIDKLELLDVNGKIVKMIISPPAIQSFNIHDLIQGVYFVRITIGQTSSVQKLIIQ